MFACYAIFGDVAAQRAIGIETITSCTANFILPFEFDQQNEIYNSYAGLVYTFENAVTKWERKTHTHSRFGHVSNIKLTRFACSPSFFHSFAPYIKFSSCTRHFSPNIAPFYTLKSELKVFHLIFAAMNFEIHPMRCVDVRARITFVLLRETLLCRSLPLRRIYTMFENDNQFFKSHTYDNAVHRCASHYLLSEKKEKLSAVYNLYCKIHQ